MARGAGPWSITQIGQRKSAHRHEQLVHDHTRGCSSPASPRTRKRHARDRRPLASWKPGHLGRFRAFLGHFGNLPVSTTKHRIHRLHPEHPHARSCRLAQPSGGRTYQRVPPISALDPFLFTETAASLTHTPCMLDWNDTGAGDRDSIRSSPYGHGRTGGFARLYGTGSTTCSGSAGENTWILPIRRPPPYTSLVSIFHPLLKMRGIP